MQDNTSTAVAEPQPQIVNTEQAIKALLGGGTDRAAAEQIVELTARTPDKRFVFQGVTFQLEDGAEVTKYTYDLGGDHERYDASAMFDSEQEARAAAKDAVDADHPVAEIIGFTRLRPSGLSTSDDHLQAILKRIGEQAFSVIGEASEEWPDPSNSAIEAAKRAIDLALVELDRGCSERWLPNVIGKVGVVTAETNEPAPDSDDNTTTTPSETA